MTHPERTAFNRLCELLEMALLNDQFQPNIPNAEAICRLAYSEATERLREYALPERAA